MIETKVIKVSTYMEQAEIDIYQNFGWTLQNSQEIYSQDSHQEVRGKDLYSVTNTTNYVKLTFSRDPSMPHYSEVVKLEREYYALLAQRTDDTISPAKAFFLFLLFVFPCVIYIVVKTKRKRKNRELAAQMREKRKQSVALLS